MTHTEDVLTEKQVIQELGISRGTLYQWRNKGKIAPVVYPSNLDKPRVFFRRSDVERLKKVPVFTPISQPQAS